MCDRRFDGQPGPGSTEMAWSVPMSFLRGVTTRSGASAFSGWRLGLAVLTLTSVVLPSLLVGPAQASTRAAGAGSACAPSVVNGVIPAWASEGFHPAKFRMHYEL